MANTTTHSNIVQMVLIGLDANKTRGQEWPNDAEFLIFYRAYNWPTYDQRTRHQFFSSKSAVLDFLAKMRDFAELEDNYFDIEAVYAWDWGPVEITVDQFFGDQA